MDNNHYTSIRNIQIVLYLLKAHGIKKVIASPGTQNMSLVVSMQRDSFFEMYSAADERSAAYMACGLAAESGEPVVLSCTGATASRNYLPGLTEAYYRHLPVVAITSTQNVAAVGQNMAQVIDRSSIQKDVAKISVWARTVSCPDDEWDCTLQVNKALLELNHHGRGPVHINLEKSEGESFSVSELPCTRIIRRVTLHDIVPSLPKGRIAVFVGSHLEWSKELTRQVDAFCAAYNSCVFCDQTSNYKGYYRLNLSLLASQDWYSSPVFNTDLLIQIGDVSGDYYLQGKLGANTKQVWNVCEDGKIKDTFQKLTHVFEMDELSFFSSFSSENKENKESYFQECIAEYEKVKEKIPELPFCNIWMAQQMAPRIPENSILHLGILNSLRAWNFSEVPLSVNCYCNVGGFGIDGGMSTLIGSSLAHPHQLHFGVYGDLAFFYDMNSLGNRHVNNNLRIVLVNNAKGSEFKLYSHPASRLGEEADAFIAAAGHYGQKSPLLVKHYSEDLGFEYLTASTKDEFKKVVGKFLQSTLTDKPMLLEVFTDALDESSALKTMNSLVKSVENQRKDKIKALIGENNAHAIQRVIDKLKR